MELSESPLRNLPFLPPSRRPAAPPWPPSTSPEATQALRAVRVGKGPSVCHALCFLAANFTWQRPQCMSRPVFFCRKFHMAKAPAYVTPGVFLTQISHGKGPSVCHALCFCVANFTWQRPQRSLAYVTRSVFLSQISHGKGPSVCHDANFTWQRSQRMSRPVFFCRKFHVAKARAVALFFVANFTCWQRSKGPSVCHALCFCRKFHMAQAPAYVTPAYVTPCVFCRKFHMAKAPAYVTPCVLLSQFHMTKAPAYVTPCVFVSQISHGKGPSVCHALCVFVANLTWQRPQCVSRTVCVLSQMSHGKGPSVCHALCVFCRKFHMAKAPAYVTHCVCFVANFTWQRPWRVSRPVFFLSQISHGKGPSVCRAL